VIDLVHERGREAPLAKIRFEELGIGFGEVTADGRFGLKEVECLAACGGAPMMQVGRTYYENLTVDRIDEILESLD
jgi:NADH-quinone oxidoreductase subunit E